MGRGSLGSGLLVLFSFLRFQIRRSCSVKNLYFKKNVRFFVDALNARQKWLLCHRCANALHNCIQMQAHIKMFAFYAMH